MNYVASAPGKVILFGEHAVVYGKTAIAASIDLRTHVYCSPQGNDIVELICPDIGYQGTWSLNTLRSMASKFQKNPAHKELQEIFAGIKCSNPDSLERLSRLNIDLDLVQAELSEFLAPGLDNSQKGAALSFLTLMALLFSSDMGMLGRGFMMAVQSTLPVGAGLGSSASFSVSVGGALLNLLFPEFLSKNPNCLELVNRLGYLAERVIHGNPSGVDNTVSTYGKFVTYQKGEFSKLHSLSSLRILLTNSKVPRNTKQMVAGVREFRNQVNHHFFPV
ncbi:Mevalonate kinase [Entomophthora muscae]|uniref:Mevalonate kinase n=1 Tax=Entomophthora muscae TaxID=34485 RepID=A0ACC2RUS1_9FUNG|nr:Mevalonate kinase [Entomophthora muscae]